MSTTPTVTPTTLSGTSHMIQMIQLAFQTTSSTGSTRMDTTMVSSESMINIHLVVVVLVLLQLTWNDGTHVAGPPMTLNQTYLDAVNKISDPKLNTY